MKPAVFDYVRPKSPQEAVQSLAGAQAKVLAGGQSLVPLMNFRLNRPELVVDINDMDGLSGIIDHATHLVIGALVRHQQLVDDAVVAERLPVLSRAAQHIGHWAIRNRGTIGGSLAHADPASELPAVLTALGGTVIVQSAQGQRRIPADEFLLGYFTTSLERNELIVEVELPIPEGRVGFSEVVRRPGDFALVGALAERSARGGSVTWFGVGGLPQRFPIELWPAGVQERRSLLAELAGALELQPDEEYKRIVGVNVAMRAFDDAGEGN